MITGGLRPTSCSVLAMKASSKLRARSKAMVYSSRARELYRILSLFFVCLSLSVSVRPAMACIDLTVSSSSDEDDVVCTGAGVDLKVELTKSPASSPDRKKKRFVACIISVNKLD